MSQQTAEQFLMGGGVASAKFERPGDTVTGTVHDQPEMRQQTDLATGALKRWDDGRPMMQLVVTLQTTERTDNEDDGLRRVYVKGKSLTEAIREAVKASGAKGLEVGGRLAVRYTGDGPQEKKGFNPPKLYAAQYARPTNAQADAFLSSGGQAQDAEPPF